MTTAATYERARISRDPRFDGRFFVAVRTTGIYCRPICPAVTPKRQNVEFFTTAAAAGEAGYRPCLRCRPECAPGSPAWNGTSTTVRRGLRLIAEGALDTGGVEALATRLGVTGRHLRRLFQAHVGASPQAIAHTQRLHFAKSLIDQTSLPMADIAIAAGYGSTRRFNDAVKKTWGRAPRELRRLQANGISHGPLSLRVPYHGPYDWDLVAGFLADRAIPGVDQYDNGSYRRAVRTPSGSVFVEVRDAGGALDVTVHGAAPENLFPVVQRVREVFDVDAPIAEIAAELSGDPLLASALDVFPGIRVPGTFDPFEHIVRAVLGQQVSVKAATTLAARVAERYGEPLEPAAGPEGGLAGVDCPGIDRLFPEPGRLVRARLETLGITSARAATIRRIASAVHRGDLDLDPSRDRGVFVESFTAIRGVGEWTAQYVLLRGMKDPDAFPASDLGILKALGAPDAKRASVNEVLARADAWRPWRAYAAVLLWKQAAAGG